MLNASPNLKVLRKVSDLTRGTLIYLLDEYARRRISIDPDTNRPRADAIDPQSGWVDNDLPRDEAITLELMDQTKGFAVSGPFGNIAAEFPTLEKAEKARRGATVRLDVQVEGIETPEDEGTGELAGPARRPNDIPGLSGYSMSAS